MMQNGTSTSCESIRSFLDDRNELVFELERDRIIEEHRKDAKEKLFIRDDLLRREHQLTNELRELVSLRSVPGFILEVETNLELFEFENCLYSLKTLRKKLYDNASIINKSFSLQQSIARYVDTLHLKIVGSIYRLFATGFWKVDNESITFQNTIKWGRDGLELEYAPFLEFVMDFFFPKGHLNTNLWVISDMKLGDMQETVRTNLNSIGNDYIRLETITEKIKEAIFTKNKHILFNDTEHTVRFEYFRVSGDEASLKAIESFENIAYFINETLMFRDKKILVEKLGPILLNELLKFIKANAIVILQSQDFKLKDKVSSVNEILKSLSKSVQVNLESKTVEVERLLNSEELHLNLKLEGIFQEHLKATRSLFTSKHLKAFKEVAINRLSCDKEIKSAVDRNEGENKNPKNDETEDWGWEADDGWDDHIDLDIDNDVDKESRVSKKNKKNDDKGDVEDGWDETWDVEIDSQDEKVSLKSSENQLTIEITELPENFIKVIQEFEKEYKDTASETLNEHYFRHKLNVLQTSYMAMCMARFRDKWSLLFNDVYFIIKTNSDLTRLHELAMNYLEFNLQTRKSFCNNLVSEQLHDFRRLEADPSWDLTITKLLPFIRNDVISSFSLISNELAEECLLRFLKFLYEDCILKNIMSWRVISAKNSENLSEFISLVRAKTEIQILSSNKDYQETREKFSIVGRFLPLHLKDIMEMFYRGDFYLFDTDEIIQWIILLFAETPLRRDAIDDIREIRNVQIEEE